MMKKERQGDHGLPPGVHGVTLLLATPGARPGPQAHGWVQPLTAAGGDDGLHLALRLDPALRRDGWG
jgi:hypothetical protein